MSLFDKLRNAGAGALSVEGQRPASTERPAGSTRTPLTEEDLHGKVVLADFWTYTCINWLRTLAYVRAWAERYEDQGLVVVGVHTPEFPFEQDLDNVREAAKDMRVEYPIALDSDYAVWDAFANRYWPAVYIADAQGRIRHHQFGEGGYEECERIIQRLLRRGGTRGHWGRSGLRRSGRSRGTGRLGTTWRSPETYLGYQQGHNFASPGGAVLDEPRTYIVPDSLHLNRWALVRGLDGRGRGERAEPSGWTDRVPLPRPRRPSRPAIAAREARPCRSACCRRSASRSRPRARRRRRGPRHADPAAALSAGSASAVRSPTARSRSPSSLPASRPTCSRSARHPGRGIHPAV